MIDLLMKREAIRKALADCRAHLPAEKRETGDWYGYTLALVANLNHVNELIARAAYEIYLKQKEGV